MKKYRVDYKFIGTIEFEAHNLDEAEYMAEHIAYEDLNADEKFKIDKIDEFEELSK